GDRFGADPGSLHRRDARRDGRTTEGVGSARVHRYRTGRHLRREWWRRRGLPARWTQGRPRAIRRLIEVRQIFGTTCPWRSALHGYVQGWRPGWFRLAARQIQSSHPRAVPRRPRLRHQPPHRPRVTRRTVADTKRSYVV